MDDLVKWLTSLQSIVQLAAGAAGALGLRKLWSWMRRDREIDTAKTLSNIAGEWTKRLMAERDQARKEWRDETDKVRGDMQREIDDLKAELWRVEQELEQERKVRMEREAEIAGMMAMMEIAKTRVPKAVPE